MSFTLSHRCCKLYSRKTCILHVRCLKVDESCCLVLHTSKLNVIKTAKFSQESTSDTCFGLLRCSTLQQVWRRLPGQQEESVESLKAQSGEEDGAVEALVHSGSESGGQPTEAVAERRRGWLQRLAQLQNVAASAASTVGGMSNIMPTYIHFGQTVTWPAVSCSSIGSCISSRYI